MESQNTKQLTQDNHNEVSENLKLAEAIVVNENHDILENSSFELNLDEFNNGTFAQPVAGLSGERRKKALCWDKVLNKLVECPDP